MATKIDFAKTEYTKKIVVNYNGGAESWENLQGFAFENNKFNGSLADAIVEDHGGIRCIGVCKYGLIYEAECTPNSPITQVRLLEFNEIEKKDYVVEIDSDKVDPDDIVVE